MSREGASMAGMRMFKCYSCGHGWEEPYGTGRPMTCPKCGSNNIHRADVDRGRRSVARGYGAGRRQTGPERPGEEG